MGRHSSAIQFNKRMKHKETGECEMVSRIIEEIPAPPIIALVLEGGGVRGIAYAGVVKILAWTGILQQIQHIAGSSIGAISAMLIALSYSVDEIEILLKSIPLEEFLEDEKSWFFTPALITKGKKYYSILNNDGHSLSSGKKLTEWVENLIEEKLGSKKATFANLAKRVELQNNNQSPYKFLHVTGTNLSKNHLEIFNHDNTPNMRIALAVSISAAYPTLFKWIEWDKGQGTDLYIDGGVINNLPSNIFNNKKYLPPGYEFTETGANPAILNVKIDTEAEIEQIFWNKYNEKCIKGIMNYSLAVMCAMQSRDAEINEQFPTNTIQIYDCNIDSLEFSIDENKKKLLIESGCDATWRWVKAHAGEAYHMRVYENEKEWLMAKSIDEAMSIKETYQQMLDVEKNSSARRQDFIHQLETKIAWLNKYLKYRLEYGNKSTFFTSVGFINGCTAHIDIEPIKPRIEIDKRIKDIMKKIISMMESEIRIIEKQLTDNKSEVEVPEIYRLHDQHIFEQIINLAVLEEKYKHLKNSCKHLLKNLEENSDDIAEKELLSSEKLAALNVEIKKILTKKTILFHAHLSFFRLVDAHLTKKEVKFDSNDGLRITLDLVNLEDYKLYIMSCMIYLKFIQCPSEMDNKIRDAYAQLFGEDRAPQNLAQLEKFLKLDKIPLLIAAYRIEALITKFLQVDKPKEVYDALLVTLDVIFDFLSGIKSNRSKIISKSNPKGKWLELKFIHYTNDEKSSFFYKLSLVASPSTLFNNMQTLETAERTMNKIPKAMRRC